MKIDRIIIDQENNNDHYLLLAHLVTGRDDGGILCHSLEEAKAEALKIIEAFPEKAIRIEIVFRTYQGGWTRPADLFKVFPEARYVLTEKEAGELKKQKDPSRIERVTWEPS